MKVTLDHESLTKMKALLDEGWSFNYACGAIGMNRNHQAALVSVCDEIKEMREKYLASKGRKYITERLNPNP